jgi:hypothetical protein
MFALIVVAIASLIGTAQDTAAPSMTQLLDAAERGDQEAILQLGTRGEADRAATVALLNRIRSSWANKNYGSPSACAQMALAKLGDNDAMSEILAELAGDEPGVQDNAIKKLTYVASPAAIEVLIGLLDDDKPRKMKEWSGSSGEKPQGKILYYPINVMAMEALAEIIPNPVVIPGQRTPPTKEHIQQWREWWSENKGKHKWE